VKYQGGNSIRVGEHPAAKRYLSLLQHAGFETIIEQEIEVMTWEKALINAVINPLGAITGLTNGGLLKDQGIRETMCSIMDEGCQVAKERGLEINSEKLFAKALNVLEESAPNRCSMLQDVDGGRKTEIEDINGVILQLAEKLLVDVPILQTITNLIKAIERK